MISVGRIIDVISNGPEGGELASVSMAGVSPVDGSIIIKERAFQFWPESLSVSAEIGWNFKEIPGLSHALAQWTQNGGRTFTFSVQFSRFMKPWPNGELSWQQVRSLGLNKPDSETPIDNRPMNISVKEQIQWMRQFYLPDYTQADVSGVQSTVSVPPPICMICFPKMGLNEDTSDVIWAVLTQFDEEYVLCFPNGEPRMATVSLGFKQVIQWPGQGLIPKSRSMLNKSVVGGKTVPMAEYHVDIGGGRKGNKMDETKGP